MLASAAEWTKTDDQVIQQALTDTSRTGKQNLWKSIGKKLGRTEQECLLRYKTVLSAPKHQNDDDDATVGNGLLPALGIEYEGRQQPSRHLLQHEDPLVALHRHLFEQSAMSPEDWPSSRGRQAKESMGYGEVGLDSMGAILEAVQALQGLRIGGTFFDLGSGRGHAVLAAATFPAGRSLFNRCVGIELHEPLHHTALRAVARWDDKSKALARSAALPAIELRLGDFLEESWDDASVVFAVSTLFEDNLMAEMAAKATSLPPGTVFVTVSHPLPAKNWTIRNVLQLPFSWTKDRGSYVFIQQRS